MNTMIRCFVLKTGLVAALAAAPGALLTQPAALAQMNSGQMSSMGSMSSTASSPAAIFNKLFSDEEKDFVDAADAMPADKFNFAPTSGDFKGVRTYAEEIKHVTEANYGFFHGWNIPNAKSRADIEKLSSKEDIMAALRESFAYAQAAINTITAENAFTPMPGSGTRAGTATHAIAHLMDHYGQMVEYLRMNSIIPPASRKPAA
jgi:uncharacterized damage-inducible protein DinB